MYRNIRSFLNMTYFELLYIIFLHLLRRKEIALKKVFYRNISYFFLVIALKNYYCLHFGGNVVIYLRFVWLFIELFASEHIGSIKYGFERDFYKCKNWNNKNYKRKYLFLVSGAETSGSFVRKCIFINSI